MSTLYFKMVWRQTRKIMFPVVYLLSDITNPFCDGKQIDHLKSTQNMPSYPFHFSVPCWLHLKPKNVCSHCDTAIKVHSKCIHLITLLLQMVAELLAPASLVSAGLEATTVPMPRAGTWGYTFFQWFLAGRVPSSNCGYAQPQCCSKVPKTRTVFNSLTQVINWIVA